MDTTGRHRAVYIISVAAELIRIRRGRPDPLSGAS